ncbi:hypothetical protein ACFC1R_01880 [Kitasatospora sp. NPDC056138]|uniref:hypothetical protein n=1 Tax=Kitasatospora sp. NPDC056138 TaxID=3345724 RepID=UPI0035E0029A
MPTTLLRDTAEIGGLPDDLRAADPVTGPAGAAHGHQSRLDRRSASALDRRSASANSRKATRRLAIGAAVPR